MKTIVLTIFVIALFISIALMFIPAMLVYASRLAYTSVEMAVDAARDHAENKKNKETQ